MACSKAGLQNHPMKVFKNLKIADGEYLHYGEYSGGDKISDWYFVTKIITNTNGGFYYKEFIELISTSSKMKYIENYSNWPISCAVDSGTGSTIESICIVDPKYMNNFEKFGLGGIVYASYHLNSKANIAKGVVKTQKNGEILTTYYTIKINPDYSYMEGWNAVSLSFRVMDPNSTGIINYVLPTFMKEPLATTLKLDRKDTVTTKAGTFNVRKVEFVLGDPFISKLMESFIKNSTFLIEDSDRRLMIKKQDISSSMFLEEISNVR